MEIGGKDMSTKIYANARFGLREDTLENWSKNNPILEKGEPAVVRDGVNGEWLKIGDGITDFNRLPWKKGPKGEQGIQGIKGDKGDKGDAGKDAVTDQTYNPNSPNAQSGKAVNEALLVFEEIPIEYVGVFTATHKVTNGVYEIIEIDTEGESTWLYFDAGHLHLLVPSFLLPPLRVGSKIYIEFGEEIAEGLGEYPVNKLAAVKDKYLTEETLQKNYELIATIKVTPDVDGNLPTSIIFTEDSNGYPFELTDFFLVMTAGCTDGNTGLYLNANNSTVMGNVIVGFKSDGLRVSTFYFNCNKDIITVSVSTSNAAPYWYSNQLGMVRTLNIPLKAPTAYNLFPVTTVSVTAPLGNAKTWIDGSNFELWGVRK